MNGNTVDKDVFFLGPFVLMPAATDNPFAGRCAFNGAFNLINDFLPTAVVPKLKTVKAVTITGVMTVPFDESGHCRLTV